MAKSNRATRKELETVIQEMIKELQMLKQGLQMLKQGFTAIDNYLGAYVKFKGDTLTFHDYLSTEMEKRKRETETITNNPKAKDVESAKKSRYKKVVTPPL